LGAMFALDLCKNKTRVTIGKSRVPVRLRWYSTGSLQYRPAGGVRLAPSVFRCFSIRLFWHQPPGADGNNAQISQRVDLGEGGLSYGSNRSSGGFSYRMVIESETGIERGKEECLSIKASVYRRGHRVRDPARARNRAQHQPDPPAAFAPGWIDTLSLASAR